jgi:hypothetical protein
VPRYFGCCGGSIDFNSRRYGHTAECEYMNALCGRCGHSRREHKMDACPNTVLPTFEPVAALGEPPAAPPQSSRFVASQWLIDHGFDVQIEVNNQQGDPFFVAHLLDVAVNGTQLRHRNEATPSGTGEAAAPSLEHATDWLNDQRFVKNEDGRGWRSISTGKVLTLGEILVAYVSALSAGAQAKEANRG